MIWEFVLLGIVGAGVRIAIQLIRDRKFPHPFYISLVELFVGAVSGYVSYYLVTFYALTNHLTALAFGYMGIDALENLLRGYLPKR